MLLHPENENGRSLQNIGTYPSYAAISTNIVQILGKAVQH
jgi:hypothetical protein